MSAQDPAPAADAEILAELIARSREANAALLRGDSDGYRARVPHSDDYLLMSPFGGTPTRGAELTEEKWRAVGRFFKNGTFTQDVVQSYVSADMVVLALIEHCQVEAGGLPPQEWRLRVTLVYRRAGSEWQLVHRHADPLGHPIGLEQAAMLARGEAPAAPNAAATTPRAIVAQPIVARPGDPPIAAAGDSFVIREWTMSGPDWMHAHQADDEAWHVLEGTLRFDLPGGAIDAPAGTTVFVPAGVAHTYRAIEPSRYLIVLTPKIDRLIARLLAPAQVQDLPATLGRFDTALTDRTE
jgi:quercetin dioxygenase-like cupin family protein/ketosteroid isomerase-like protein